MKIATEINVGTSGGVPQRIHVKQGDKNTRLVRVRLIVDGCAMQFESGVTSVMRFQKTNGTRTEVAGDMSEDGVVSAIVPASVMSSAGSVLADVALLKGDEEILSTEVFYIMVDDAPTNGTQVSPDNTGTVTPTPGGGVSQEQLDAAVQRAVSSAITTEAKRVDLELGIIKEQTKVTIRPRVCFVDDDGAVEAKAVLFPWLVANDVPYTFAIAVGDTASGDSRFASWDDLRTMQADSRVSWSCHAVGDDVMADFTAEEMGARYAQWRRDMVAHGLRSDATTVMYNHGSYVQDTIDRAVSKYFRYGFTVTKGINTAPLDSYHMKRVGLFPTDGSFTIAQAKAQVDRLVAAKTGVLIFFTHAYYETFNLAGLTELVEYVRSKGIEIAPLEDTLRLYEPVSNCDCGDWTEVSADPEYNRTIAQATSATSGQKVTNSSEQNCVMTVPVSGGKRIKASGTAYSNNGMITWLDSEGRVIGCIWQAANKSGDNAKFTMELAIPYGAAQVMVSGNSGRQLPRVEVLSTGSGGVSRQEFEDYKSQQSESILETRQYAENLVSAAIADVAPLMVQLTALQEDSLGGL